MTRRACGVFFVFVFCLFFVCLAFALVSANTMFEETGSNAMGVLMQVAGTNPFLPILLAGKPKSLICGQLSARRNQYLFVYMYLIKVLVLACMCTG